VRKRLSRPVDIIGVGITKLGFVTETPEIKNMTSRELWTWASQDAIQDAGVSLRNVDALFVGNMISELSEDQYHLGNVLTQWTGMSTGNGAWKSAVRVEGACASSSHAIRQAVFAIAAGVYDIVIAGGVEINNAKIGSKAPGQPRKMTNDERLRAIYCHYDQAWDLPQLSLQDMNLSQWMLAYCQEYGLSIETLYDVLDGRIASNYRNGQFNPKAYWNRSLKDAAADAGFDNPRHFLRSPERNPLAHWPLRLWDGPRRCDGAGAVVLCAADLSKQFRKRPIHYLGTGNAHGTSISEKMFTHPMILDASKQAYEMAAVSPGEIDVVEVYDFIAPEYIIPLEDIGYFGRGEAWKALIDARTTFEGDKPVNPSGGSTAGSVVGSIGAVQTYYLVKQLRGEAGKNQIGPIPRIALAYDCGAARDAVVHIYGRD
jgi:acetyl-CoA C-acetyltransferase